MKNPDNKKAALYIRVSTDAQAEEGYSIDFQKEKLITYCKLNDIKDYEVYEDGGWSGSNLNRPAMNRLEDDIDRGKISHVIIYKLDRLSRSQKDTLFLIEDKFIPNEITFISLTENLDTSNAMGRAMIGILSAFAQLERENIYMRTREGMIARVKDGKWPGGAAVPFGYDYSSEKNTLIPNSDAATVKAVYEQYLMGYSAQRIADMFGLKYERLAMNILTRRTYYGVIEYKNKIYQGIHEPLISKELFDRAQEEIRKRSENTIRDTGSHLLTGLVYCGHCGAKMRYIKWGKKGYKFFCYSQQNSKAYLVKDPNCKQDKVWAEDIEHAVVNKLFNINIDEINKPVKDESNKNNIITELKRNKDELDRAIRRLYDLYANSPIPDNNLLHVINEKKQRLVSVNSSLEKELEKANNEASRERIRKAVTNLKESWDNMSINEQQSIVRLLVHKIIITDNSINIIMNI